jgi:hypothetical protein
MCGGANKRPLILPEGCFSLMIHPLADPTPSFARVLLVSRDGSLKGTPRQNEDVLGICVGGLPKGAAHSLPGELNWKVGPRRPAESVREQL